jgi:hypothetical protein
MASEVPDLFGRKKGREEGRKEGKKVRKGDE